MDTSAGQFVKASNSVLLCETSMRSKSKSGRGCFNSCCPVTIGWNQRIQRQMRGITAEKPHLVARLQAPLRVQTTYYVRLFPTSVCFVGLLPA